MIIHSLKLFCAVGLFFLKEKRSQGKNESNELGLLWVLRENAKNIKTTKKLTCQIDIVMKCDYKIKKISTVSRFGCDNDKKASTFEIMGRIINSKIM